MCYQDIDAEVANEWNQDIYETLQDFPELRPRLRFVGTIRARNRLFVKLNLESRKERIRQRHPDLSEKEVETKARRSLLMWCERRRLWGVSTPAGGTGGEVSGIAMDERSHSCADYEGSY